MAGALIYVCFVSLICASSGSAPHQCKDGNCGADPDADVLLQKRVLMHDVEPQGDEAPDTGDFSASPGAFSLEETCKNDPAESERYQEQQKIELYQSSSKTPTRAASNQSATNTTMDEIAAQLDKLSIFAKEEAAPAKKTKKKKKKRDNAALNAELFAKAKAEADKLRSEESTVEDANAAADDTKEWRIVNPMLGAVVSDEHALPELEDQSDYGDQPMFTVPEPLLPTTFEAEDAAAPAKKTKKTKKKKKRDNAALNAELFAKAKAEADKLRSEESTVEDDAAADDTKEWRIFNPMLGAVVSDEHALPEVEDQSEYGDQLMFTVPEPLLPTTFEADN